jgi:hypothetical protein
MRLIIGFLKQYFYEVNKQVLVFTTLLAAIFICANYHYDIDGYITSQYSFKQSFALRYMTFLPAFFIPYILVVIAEKKKYFSNWKFIALLLIAPAIFSLKTELRLSFEFSDNYDWNYYWHYIVYWPLLVIIVSCILFIIWKVLHPENNFYGLKFTGVDWKPYWIMLLIMVPLIAAASTQRDFLSMYPKMKVVAGIYDLQNLSFWNKLLFELSYGSDFITIELFFRGFLILGFIKWVGKDAILPMAFFYCTIHFGKPLGECISSFFGGMILGVVVYHTRSILGGLIVHLGIAWLMELGGHIGNSLK